MPNENFDAFFEQATGHPPYAYQRRLAGVSEGPAPAGPPTATPAPTCPFPRISQLINIPTGLGKTNGTLSWTARVLSLRDAADLGLFRLAWLETLLRAADAVGSAQPNHTAQS